MRKCIAGDGSDSTAAVLALLAQHHELILADVYLIDEPESPTSLWLTNWPTPLTWPVWTDEKQSGTGVFPKAFDPAVIRRGQVSTKIGLEVDTLEITWSPPPADFTDNVANTSPYQLAQTNFYTNKKVRLWSCYMPTPGDANTLGCSEFFGGIIGDVKTQRGSIVFSITSFEALLDEAVPSNVIQLNDQFAAYTGGVPPSGFSVYPQFTVQVGSTPTVLIALETSPNFQEQITAGQLVPSYVIFNPGSSLAGLWSAVFQNQPTGLHNNQIVLYTPMPWAPAPGDTFVLVGNPPVNPPAGPGPYNGISSFNFVPAPPSGV